MRFNAHFFKDYLRDAPLPLALERAWECTILSTKKFERPILDIGCGEGLFAKKLFKDKIDTGIDPNPRELECAYNHKIYNELILCKGDKIPKANGVYKTIISNSVMEHIPEIDRVLSEAHRLLSDEGNFYLTVPTCRFDQYTLVFQCLKKLRLIRLQNYYRQAFNAFWSHYHYYEVNDWINKFKENGFKVVEFQEYASKKECIINSILSPFSILSFISKKTINRWFIFPKLRKMTATFLYFLFNSCSKKIAVNPGQGGLIFFNLVKE